MGPPAVLLLLILHCMPLLSLPLFRAPTNKRQNWQSSSRATSFCLSCLTLALGAASAGIMALPHPTAYTYLCMYVLCVRTYVCVCVYICIYPFGQRIAQERERGPRNACFINWPHYFAQFNSSLRQSFQLNISQVCRGRGVGGVLHIERTSGHPRLSYPLTSAYATFQFLSPLQRLSHSHAHFRRFTAKL